MRRAPVGAVALGLAPGPARAHAFETGQDAYGAFVEGAGVVLTSPGLILPVLSLGLAFGLAGRARLGRRVGALALAALAGALAAPWAGPWAMIVVLVFAGVLAGAVTLLDPARLVGVSTSLGPLVAGAVTLAALEGHGWAEAGAMLRAGVVFAVMLGGMAIGGLVRATLEPWPGAGWLVLGWRIAASWLAAILVLYLAFSLRG